MDSPLLCWEMLSKCSYIHWNSNLQNLLFHCISVRSLKYSKYLQAIYLNVYRTTTTKYQFLSNCKPYPFKDKNLFQIYFQFLIRGRPCMTSDVRRRRTQPNLISYLIYLLSPIDLLVNLKNMRRWLAERYGGNSKY